MGVIFGPEMTPILSGAIIYEWTQEANDYGIISYPDNAIQENVEVPVGVPTPLQPEFDNLKSVWAAVSPSSISEVQYSFTTVVMACPEVTAGWTIDGNAALPPSPGSVNV